MTSARKCRTLARFLDGPGRTDRARALLDRCGTVRALMHASRHGTLPADLLSGVERARLRAVVKLVAMAVAPAAGEALTRPEDVVRACDSLWTGMHEEIRVVACDTRLRPLFIRSVGSGGPGRSSARISDIMRPPLAVGATGFFVLHNHPSGNAMPSPEDHDFTHQIRRQCDVVGLVLHDHIVVAGRRWTSCVSGLTGVWFDDDGGILRQQRSRSSMAGKGA